MSAASLHLNLPADLAPEATALVVRFAEALGAKLLAKQGRYGTSWRDPVNVPDMQVALAEHVCKGDPVDVGAFCAFLFDHGVPTAGPSCQEWVPGGGDAAIAVWNRFRLELREWWRDRRGNPEVLLEHAAAVVHWLTDLQQHPSSRVRLQSAEQRVLAFAAVRVADQGGAL